MATVIERGKNREVYEISVPRSVPHRCGRCRSSGYVPEDGGSSCTMCGAKVRDDRAG